jgi:hypothetical protein
MLAVWFHLPSRQINGVVNVGSGECCVHFVCALVRVQFHVAVIGSDARPQ